MITLKEIAQMCGVSIATVSNILNDKPKVSEDTRKKVLEVVKQTGYQPNYFAQGMRKQNTRIRGIVVEDLSKFTTPIVESMMAYCEENNYRTILVNLRLYDRWKDTWYYDERKYQSVLKPAIQELLSIKVDGIMYVAGHCRIIQCFPENFEVPAIVAYACSKSPKIPSVAIDDEKGGYDLTRYLIHMGHHRIGVISGTADNLHAQKRCIGYQKALFEDQILYDPDLVQYGDWERPSGYKCMESLIFEGVTAVFCMNDLMAAGAYDYCFEHNLIVGKDISIVGYDNVGVAEYLRPPLTTNEIQLKNIGQVSAQLLIQHLSGDCSMDELQQITKVPCRMILRDSVANIE